MASSSLPTSCSSTRSDGIPLDEARAIRALADVVSYHAFMTDLSSAAILKQACPAYPNSVPSPETITQIDVTAAFAWLDKARIRRRNLKLRRRRITTTTTPTSSSSFHGRFCTPSPTPSPSPSLSPSSPSSSPPSEGVQSMRIVNEDSIDDDESPLITLVKEIPWWAGRRYLERLSILLDYYEAIPAPMPELCYLFINEENMLREYYRL